MKNNSFIRHKVNKTRYTLLSVTLISRAIVCIKTHLVGVVHVQEPTAALVDLLVALPLTHAQRSVHVHVVARQIQTDQDLEDDAVPRESAGQENHETGCCAAVRHHVEHSAKLGALLEIAGSEAIKGIEEAGYAVEQGTGARVERHVVERAESKNDAGSTWQTSA